MVSIKEPILSPNVLFREFESGRLSRAEFHAAMSVHAAELIDEMETPGRSDNFIMPINQELIKNILQESFL